MPEEYLQTAFEIKAACDEISRRLLRWHWEQKPGAHSLNALLEHLEQRRRESPEYYDRLPDLSGKTSWQQLDTTLCMRVLLDPEQGAARPLDLLGNTPHPGAARRACNAVRAARNEAAHAADRTGAARAAVLFDEAVEYLEEGYAGTAFREAELAQYYRQAEEFRARCGGEGGRGGASASAGASAAPGRAAKPKSAKAAGGASAHRQSARAAAPARSAQGGKKSGGKAGAKPGAGAKKSAPGNKKASRRQGGSRAVWAALLLIAALGLLVRAYTMGLLP